jgi:hypothetical protein
MSLFAGYQTIESNASHSLSVRSYGARISLRILEKLDRYLFVEFYVRATQSLPYHLIWQHRILLGIRDAPIGSDAYKC